MSFDKSMNINSCFSQINHWWSYPRKGCLFHLFPNCIGPFSIANNTQIQSKSKLLCKHHFRPTRIYISFFDTSLLSTLWVHLTLVMQAKERVEHLKSEHCYSTRECGEHLADCVERTYLGQIVVKRWAKDQSQLRSDSALTNLDEFKQSLQSVDLV